LAQELRDASSQVEALHQYLGDGTSQDSDKLHREIALLTREVGQATKLKEVEISKTSKALSTIDALTMQRDIYKEKLDAYQASTSNFSLKEAESEMQRLKAEIAFFKKELEARGSQSPRSPKGDCAPCIKIKKSLLLAQEELKKREQELIKGHKSMDILTAELDRLKKANERLETDLNRMRRERDAAATAEAARCLDSLELVDQQLRRIKSEISMRNLNKGTEDEPCAQALRRAEEAYKTALEAEQSLRRALKARGGDRETGLVAATEKAAASLSSALSSLGRLEAEVSRLRNQVDAARKENAKGNLTKEDQEEIRSLKSELTKARHQHQEIVQAVNAGCLQALHGADREIRALTQSSPHQHGSIGLARAKASLGAATEKLSKFETEIRSAQNRWKDTAHPKVTEACTDTEAATFDALAELITALSKENTELRTAAVVPEVDSDGEARALRKRVKELEALLKSCTGDKHALEDEMIDLEDEISRLRAELSSAAGGSRDGDALKSLEGDNGILAGEIGRLKEELEARHAEIAALKGELSAAHAEFDRLKGAGVKTSIDKPPKSVCGICHEACMLCQPPDNEFFEPPAETLLLAALERWTEVWEHGSSEGWSGVRGSHSFQAILKRFGEHYIRPGSDPSWGAEHMAGGIWEFEDGKGKWRRFQFEACAEIESALANGEKSAKVTDKKKTLLVWLKSRKVVDMMTQQSRRIRRWCPVTLYVATGANCVPELYVVDTNMALDISS